MTAFFDGVEYTKGVVAGQAEIDRKIAKEREKSGDSRDNSSERKKKDKNKKKNTAKSAEQASVNVSSEREKASLKMSSNNIPFVVIDQDILRGVPEKDWIKAVKNNLSSKYPNGIVLGSNTIRIDNQSRKELTFSKYMQWLRHNDPQAFSDKLRATDNMDEILIATTNWINESPNHNRNDKIVSFARGDVLLRVGGNDYTASVIVGTKQNGSMIAYDIIDLKRTQIKEKEMSDAEPENSSRRAERKTSSISTNSIPDYAEKSNSFYEKIPGKRGGFTIDPNVDWSKLNPTQRASIKMVRRLSRILDGYDFVITDSFLEEKTGRYVTEESAHFNPKTKTFYISIAAGKLSESSALDFAMVQAMSHEVVHAIAADAPLLYEQLKNYVIETYYPGKSLDYVVMQRKAQYQQNEIMAAKADEREAREFTYDEALEEVIANSLEDMLTSERVLFKLAKGHRRLFARIWRYIRDFFDRVIRKIGQYSNRTVESAIVGRVHKRQLKLEDLFVKALRAANDGVAAMLNEHANSQTTENNGKIAKANTNEGSVNVSDGKEKYSLVEPFVDESGKYYESAVLLDTNFFDGLSPRNWGQKLKTYVEDRADNRPFIMNVEDEFGNVQSLSFAKKGERVHKEKGSEHSVLGELYRTGDNMSKLAVVHIDEIAEISEESNPYFSSSDGHGWLDKNGWLHRNAHVINMKNGAIYNITLDIAKTEDGRTILYATKGKIKKVGQAKVNSLVKRGSTPHSNSNVIIPDYSEKVNSIDKKSSTEKFSLLERLNREELMDTFWQLAESEEERDILREYRERIDELDELKNKGESGSNAMEKRSRQAQMNHLDERIKDIDSFISRRDEKLLTISAAKPFQDIVARHEDEAYKRGANRKGGQVSMSKGLSLTFVSSECIINV